jgi:hypothetical protein
MGDLDPDDLDPDDLDWVWGRWTSLQHILATR